MKWLTLIFIFGGGARADSCLQLLLHTHRLQLLVEAIIPKRFFFFFTFFLFLCKSKNLKSPLEAHLLFIADHAIDSDKMKDW